TGLLIAVTVPHNSGKCCISTSTNNNNQTIYDRQNNNRRRDDDDDYRRQQGYNREQNRNSSKAFRNKDWSGLLQFGRLVNSNQRGLVLQLNILEKPITRYANVVYTVYALQNNRWVQFYSSTGSRLIEKKSGRFSLQPEVIEFNKLRLGNLDLSRSDLKFVTQIRYDSTSRREESLVFEEVRNYREITEVSNVRQFSTYR
ncbi:hypothetical protein VB713_13140, partial [Anabaena cylindrica UHCC 0172]|uniref:hypothetical protein n=1 Tax=Anabaena cylindrica TaxID=1165 RepID=UPI002B1FC91A